jgi:hypothetical protein
MADLEYDRVLKVSDYIATLPIQRRIPLQVKQLIYGRQTVYRDLLKTRGEVRQFVFNRGQKLRMPDYNYAMLYDLSNKNWLLRQIFRAISGEVLNAGWNIEPRFKKKCKKCGEEYQSSEQEECDICGGKGFTKPEWTQYVKLKKLIEEPFEGKTYQDFARSTLWYDLALDDVFWEIVYEYYDTGRRAKGYRVLDSTVILPQMDEYGVLGSREFFCPVCYSDSQRIKVDAFVTREVDYNGRLSPRKPSCPTCGREMVETAYVQMVAGKVVARWKEDEIIHVSSTRVDPEAFGKSKIIPCLKHLYTIAYMDEYNFQAYGHGHLAGFLAFPGLDQTYVEAMQKNIEAQLNTKDKQDVQSGENIKTLEMAMIFLGIEDGKQPISIPFDLPMDKMQSIEFYKLYVEKVSGVFGVTPVFTSTSTAGSVESRPQIDVQNRVTKGYLEDIETPFNEQLLPKFGITDYIIKSGKIESRDELRDAQIRLTNTQAVSILQTAGFDVEVSDDMSTYSTSTKAKPPPEPVKNSRLESGRLPQDKDGAATTTMATGTEQGVPIQEPEGKTKEGSNK